MKTDRETDLRSVCGAPVLAGLAVILVATLAACSGETPGEVSRAATVALSSDASDATTRVSDGGQVMVKVTWPGAGDPLQFAVEMDSHAVDLDGYDLRLLAVLRTDQGQEARPSTWDAPKGGHHRSGALTFSAVTADDSPLVGPNTRSVELLIRDVAGVPERVFRWAL
ncbi:MAG: hypothetical protein HYY04_02195 [Chloroflexi bacterium]|nr:hypothetical protein [Chloroflexota bacterium]